MLVLRDHTWAQLLWRHRIVIRQLRLHQKQAVRAAARAGIQVCPNFHLRLRIQQRLHSPVPESLPGLEQAARLRSGGCLRRVHPGAACATTPAPVGVASTTPREECRGTRWFCNTH